MKIAGVNVRGFLRELFADAWDRTSTQDLYPPHSPATFPTRNVRRVAR